MPAGRKPEKPAIFWSFRDATDLLSTMVTQPG